MGLNASLGIRVAALAPRPEPKNAGTAIMKASLKSGFTRRKYDAVAPRVPRNDGSLFVPSKSDGAVLGIEISSEGSCISPPPPAIESTKPANPEAKTRKMITSTEIST